jgi:hypothetical protein
MRRGGKGGRQRIRLHHVDDVWKVLRPSPPGPVEKPAMKGEQKFCFRFPRDHQRHPNNGRCQAVMKREFSAQKSRFNEKFNEELIEKYLKFAPERIS